MCSNQTSLLGTDIVEGVGILEGYLPMNIHSRVEFGNLGSLSSETMCLLFSYSTVCAIDTQALHTNHSQVRDSRDLHTRSFRVQHGPYKTMIFYV